MDKIKIEEQAISREDKAITSEEQAMEREEQVMKEIKREEQVMEEIKRAMKLEMKNITKIKRKFTSRLTIEIDNEFNNLNFSLENITRKITYLKEFETEYNKSISEKILLLIKKLKMLDSDYLRDN